MTNVINTASGYADGANIDAANGGDSALASVSPGDGTIKAVASTIKGTRAYQFAMASTATPNYLLNTISGATNACAGHFYIDTTNGPPNVARSLYQFTSSTGATIRGGVAFRPDRKWQINNAAGSTVSVAPSALPAGIWRFELVIQNGTGSTDTMSVHVYSGDSTVRSTAYEPPAANSNFGTGTIAGILWGKQSTGATTMAPFLMADVRAYPGQTTEIGPTTISTTAPTASAGMAANYEPWSSATLSGTDAPGTGGAVTTRSWRQISGPAVTLVGSGAGRIYDVPASLTGATLVFGYTVTDASAVSSLESTVTHTALPVVTRAIVGGVQVPARVQLAVVPGATIAGGVTFSAAASLVAAGTLGRIGLGLGPLGTEPLGA